MVVCTSGSNDVGDAFSCVNSLISKMGTKSGEMRLSCRIDGSDLTVSKAGNSNSAFFLRLIMFLDSLTRGGRALIKFVFTTFQWKLALTMTVENCTDLGSLIGNTQYGIFRIFLLVRFYVKLILIILKSQKLQF